MMRPDCGIPAKPNGISYLRTAKTVLELLPATENVRTVVLYHGLRQWHYIRYVYPEARKIFRRFHEFAVTNTDELGSW